ncbi:MAG: hypothetical protein AVDCRST_MAG64-4203 [uncultured Phycisphaerae bacterium]|uniref:Uncharacterized protein n=1 Tax=uncultured Phycisphaerae bacterium TaxID=904963 RepID=A0A6J4QDZ7_9BACT|nr:MAG: hypothetical protein AVDCRST_MAG64-4203 [uncultured Phycisphaerae bacterium]
MDGEYGISLRARPTAGMPATLAVAGALFCLFVAIGTLGGGRRRKP